MIEITVYSMGSPPAFTRTTADANYWQERLAYEKSMMFYLMNQDSWLMSQAESDDIDAAWDDMDDYLANETTGLIPWIESAIVTREAGGTPSAPPSMPKSLELTGQLGLANILAQVRVPIELNLFRFGGSTNGGGASDSGLSDAVEGVSSKLEECFLKTVGGETFPMMELLANIPIKIIVSRAYDLQDVIIEGVT